MRRVVIIGGSGHVGTFLVPRLVEAGFHVVNVSRGQRQPYRPHKAWDAVEQVVVDRDALEARGAFGGAIFDLKPDILIDMTCFTLASAKEIVEAVKGEVEHFLHTGTIWVHGPSVTVPVTEMQPRRPFGDYGIQKAAIESYLLHEARRNGFPATIVHPGHIVGPGWEPLNPEGHFDPAVFTKLARGDEVLIPNFGMETVHHVHADDVAQMFMRAITRRSVSIGEAFHTVSPAAISLRGYAEAMSAWFGQAPNLAFLPWPDWKARQSEKDAEATFDHIAHSPSCSIAKASEMLGYVPRYTSLEAVQESVAWLIENGRVSLPGPRPA